jgi:hypothetical protein
MMPILAFHPFLEKGNSVTVCSTVPPQINRQEKQAEFPPPITVVLRKITVSSYGLNPPVPSPPVIIISNRQCPLAKLKIDAIYPIPPFGLGSWSGFLVRTARYPKSFGR